MLNQYSLRANRLDGQPGIQDWFGVGGDDDRVLNPSFFECSLAKNAAKSNKEDAGLIREAT